QIPIALAAQSLPNFPRLRALALFGRRLAEHAERLGVAGVQKPAQERTFLRPPPGAELDRSRLSAKRIAIACERLRGARADMTTIALSIPEPSAASLVAFVLSYFMAWFPVRPPVRTPTPESIGFGNPETREVISTRPQTGPMSDFVQLDLFGDRPNFDRSPNAVSLQPLLPRELSDEELIAAIPEATLADACALAAEAGKRRLSAAIPALMTLCNRFVGYGIDVGVPEQAAALEALGVIGGREASRAVVQLIVKRIVQGPTLVVATTVASQLGVIFPTDIALAFLRDSNPS